jgi:hypothetical protein
MATEILHNFFVRSEIAKHHRVSSVKRPDRDTIVVLDRHYAGLIGIDVPEECKEFVCVEVVGDGYTFRLVVADDLHGKIGK